MKITIEGTEDEIARVIRRLGETREIVTPEPAAETRKLDSIREAIEEWYRTRPGLLGDPSPAVDGPVWVAPGFVTEPIYYGDQISVRVGGCEAAPNTNIRAETRTEWTC
jgi:hypothetical protein